MAGYLLDTNIVSETRKFRPHAGVVDFLTAAHKDALYLSVLTLGELRKGVEAKRRSDPAAADLIGDWVNGIEQDFADRILPVDIGVAHRWGLLSAIRSCPVIDTLIAATALEKGLTLVTRNERDVHLTGVALFNPWTSQSPSTPGGPSGR